MHPPEIVSPTFFIKLGQDGELRLVQQHHADVLFALIDTHRATLRTWLPWVDGITGMDDAHGFIASAFKRLADGHGPTAGIWLRGALVGVIGFNGIDNTLGRTDIGYWLAPTAEGHGLATRALRAFLIVAFDELGLNKVELNIGTQNTRSAAVARRLGFTHEGLRRHAERLHDRIVDHDLYGLLRGEFRAMP